MAVVLIVYGALMAALSALLKQLHAPPFATFSAAILCAVWGFLSLGRPRPRTVPTLILVLTSVVFLMNFVNAWWRFFEGGYANLRVPLVVSLSFLLSFGVLCYLLYAERPPDYWTGRNPAGSNSQPPPSNRPR